MFTFGIFTTHIPYIAMVVFYAYFLVFGVNKASDDTIQITQKSHSFEIQSNNAIDTISADTYYSFQSYFGSNPDFIFKKSRENQKWKHLGVAKTYRRNLIGNTLFGRPPPIRA